MTRNPDDIMAEHLLTGGKMLSETCPKCGAPLFEIKGRKTCVVCAENELLAEKEIPVVHVNDEHGKLRIVNNAPNTQTHAASARGEAGCAGDAIPKNISVVTPAYAKDEVFDSTPLGAEMDDLIRILIERAKTERDSLCCKTYVECIRTAAEAKTMLVRMR